MSGDGSEGHGYGVDDVELVGLGRGRNEVGAEGGGQEEGVGREDPDWGHGVDWEDSGGFVRWRWLGEGVKKGDNRG